MYRVGINLEHIDPAYVGGVNTFARDLSFSLAKINKDYKIIFFMRDTNAHYFERIKSGPRTEIIVSKSLHKNSKRIPGVRRIIPYLPTHLKSYMVDKLTSTTAAIRNEIVDLMYTPYSAPTLYTYINKPQMFSIHDIQHEHFPQFFSKKELVERRFAFDRCTRKAALIQASSEQMQRDFISQFPVLSSAKVPIIHEGVDIEFFGSRSNFSPNIAESNLLDLKYFYMPAQLWPHKNHTTVIKAFSKLISQHEDIKLILTGAAYSAYPTIRKQIFDLSLEEHVLYLGVVNKKMVRALYQNSLAVISASLYEASSLTILEAAASGTKVIAGNTEPNIEIGRSLDLKIFENENPDSLAEIMRGVIVSDKVRSYSSNVDKILEFSWDNIARQYLYYFGRLLKEDLQF